MTAQEWVIVSLAERLENAEYQREPLTKVTEEYPELDWDDAYAIQDAIRQRKIDSGHKIVGLKAGLTSTAKMKQMGVNEPVFGFLCDYGAFPNGGAIGIDRFIAPRIEAELAFVTKSDIAGPDCDARRALDATDFVMPAIEILDSRYKNFDFDLTSVIADNTSAAGFLLGGRPRSALELDLQTLGIVLEKNGQVVDTAAGAAVLGDPAESVAMLANNLARRDQVIPAGTFIMTGGVTAAISVQRGDNISASFQGLGRLSARFS